MGLIRMGLPERRTASAGSRSYRPASQRLFSREREDRLAFDDGVVVWEGVESLNAEAAIAGFEVDVAHRAEAKAATGFEAVEQSLASAGLGELLLIGPEGFFVDRLKGECGLIVDPAVAFDGVARSALEAMGHQSP